MICVVSVASAGPTFVRDHFVAEIMVEIVKMAGSPSGDSTVCMHTIYNDLVFYLKYSNQCPK